jgi:hypothetical protein
MRASLVSLASFSAISAALLVGCGDDGAIFDDDGAGGEATGGAGVGNNGQGGIGNNGQGGVGNNGQGGVGNNGQGGVGNNGQGGVGNNGQGGQGPCAGTPANDDDNDGFSENEGDCNDCDENTNPGAIDVISVDANGDALPANQQYDEDCDGIILMPGQEPSCGAGLAMASTNAMDGAKAMDICQVAQNGSWGVVSATYVNVDGTPLPDPLGHGILPNFGSFVPTKFGSNLLALSSGTARRPTDPGYQDVGGYSKGYSSAHPPGFPIESPSCPGVVTGTPYDGAALKVVLKVPTNAQSLSFKFKFHTYEFPSYICSTYNDFFVALMDPPPMDVDPINKNIAFDSVGNPISVNNALLDVCAPGTYGGKTFTCPGDINELTGTGFETHAATSWLQTNAPVTPGSTITLTFGTYDSGDGVLDSTVVLDDFRWSALPATTGTNDACLSGGTGTCDQCVPAAVSGDGCCAEEWSTCQGNASCASLAGCVAICDGNMACINGCFTQNPAGAPLYEATLECLYGDDADPAAVGACGTVCM